MSAPSAREFTVEALYFMRDRFNQAEVWMRSSLPVDKLMEYAYHSGAMQSFRTRLFTRIVPILKEIGLFGPKVQKALGDMGVMGYAEIDVEQLIANDLKVADDFDAKKFVRDRSRRSSCGGNQMTEALRPFCTAEQDLARLGAPARICRRRGILAAAL